MYCKNCGKQITDNVDFCPNCGTKNESKITNTYNQNIYKKDNTTLPIIPITICVFVVIIIFSVHAFLNRTCSMCDNKVFKKNLCREHYSQLIINENINDVTSGKKSISDAISDTYDRGLTNAEKNRIKKSANNIKENIDDVRSGNKDIFEAAQDIYDKNLTKNEKRRIENEINDIKNSLGDLLN